LLDKEGQLFVSDGTGTITSPVKEEPDPVVSEELIESLIEHMDGYVEDKTIKEKDGKKITKNLNKALEDLGKDKTDKACKNMGKVLKDLLKLVEKDKLSEAEGLELIDTANLVITDICS